MKERRGGRGSVPIVLSVCLFSLPLRFARLLCVCTSAGVGAGACRACSHAQRASMRAMVCVARGGSVERRMLWLWRIPHRAALARRRASMPVCVHASLPPSLLGRPSVIGYREARPCQARVVRTLYSCEARRWVHGTQRGEGSCARCVRTMRIMLCYVMLSIALGRANLPRGGRLGDVEAKASGAGRRVRRGEWRADSRAPLRPISSTGDRRSRSVGYGSALYVARRHASSDEQSGCCRAANDVLRARSAR